MADRRPVIFLAFANDRDDRARYLRNLPEEARRVQKRLEEAEPRRICEVVVRTNTMVSELLDVFMDPRYRDRIAVFHFGGHAGGYQLVLESAQGCPEFAHAGGLADFLGHQGGLQLVFLNGCSTERQVEGLLQAGIPAVIATSEAIDDNTATDLSVRFYTALAGGATLASAYAEAVASVKTLKGDRARDVYRDVYRADPVICDRWPWDLVVKEGAEIVRNWSLPEAAGDPLFGLPSLPEQDLPETPYRHLQWFREEDAELFFGRGREIRTFYELATSPSAAPLVLFYGQSGVGKSSILAAGLLPRLVSSHEVRYARRQRELGLTETLMAALEPHGPDAPLAEVWHALESTADRPLVVILDQVEEAYTRPRRDDPGELERFVRVLTETFAERSARPRGKLVLGFRKEWLADLEERLRESKIPRSKSYLERFDRNGIIEIVEGPVRSERLRRHLNLSIEPGLAELIADNLLEDRDAPVAPTLGVLLTKMWKHAKTRNTHAPEFATDLYQELRSKGLLLDDFVDEQLNAMRDWNAQVVDTGLALDLLAFHTTPLGTGESRSKAEVDATYSHQTSALPELLQRGKDLYLLVDHEPQGQERSNQADGTRLAHDTLAPLLRRRFKDSDLPGQRARRILENRGGEWRGGQAGSLLDQTDLATVERGESGMPAWSPDERRLIQASRAWRRNRRWVLRGVVAAALAAVALITGLYFSARSNERRAVILADRSLSQVLASEAYGERRLNLALLLSVEALRTDTTFDARDALLSTLLRRSPRLISRWAANERVHDVAVSPDGTILAAGASGIQLWNLRTREQIGEPLGSGAAFSVEFSPDGATLASGTGSTIRFWDVKTRQPIGEPLEGHEGPVLGVAISPDGATLASASNDSTVRLWDVKTHRPIGEPLAGNPGYVSSVVFSPDGATLASGGGHGNIHLWSVKSRRRIGKPLEDAAGTGPKFGVAFSPDGRTLASTAADGTIQLWDMKTREPIGKPWTGNAGPAVSVAWSRDGATLASGGIDGTIHLWDMKTRRTIGEPLVAHKGAVFSLAFLPDNTTLASGGEDSAVRIWDVKPHDPIGEALGKQEGTVSIVAFSPDGAILASGGEDSTVRLWDVKTRRPIGEPLAAHSGKVSSIAFSHDGATLAIGGNGSVHLWDVKSRRPIGEPFTERSGYETSVAFSPDGASLAIGSQSGTVHLWDVKTRQRIGEPHTIDAGRVQSVAISPDGTILAVGSDRSINLWDMKLRRSIGKVLEEGADVHYVVAFSPNGTTLASGRVDGSIGLWDTKTGQPIGEPLVAHKGGVLSVAFSPDGATLASGSLDGTARLWDVKSHRPVGVALTGHAGAVWSVAFSSDGTTLATGGDDGTVRLWDATTAGWVRRACALADRNLTADEWIRFLPGRPYECSCNGLPSGEEGMKACPRRETF